MEKNHPEIKNVILCKKLDGSIGHIIGYVFHMFRQMRHIASSKVVILDGYCITVSALKHKSKTKIIQLWHAATAVKRFGYQTLDMPSGSDSKIAKVMRMHKNYDYIIASSKVTGEFYCKGFNVDSRKIVYLAMPHFQTLFNSDEIKKKEMHSKYPQLKEKQNILYIPTFRKSKETQLKELTDVLNFEKYNLIVRLHPLDQTKKNDRRIIFDDVYTTYDWMKLSDMIINDYSSLVIETAILEKPTFFYEYDLEEYKKDPGLNLDMRQETLGKYVFQSPKDLNHMLETEYDFDALKKFKKKFIETDLTNSIENFTNFIVRILENE